MPPKKRVRIANATEPSMPVRVVTHGPSDPVEIVTSGPSDPVRIVTEGISDPVRGSFAPPTPPYVPVPWYLTAGLVVGDVVCAYKSKGAASLADSYKNLANPGTNDAMPGIAPTWTAEGGWIFNGTNQYLSTQSINVTEQTTLIIKYSDTTNRGQIISGSETGNNDQIFYIEFDDEGGWYRFYNGDVNSYALGYPGNSGILALTYDGGYLNGTIQVTFSTPPTQFSNNLSVFIGAVNGFGTPGVYYQGNIQAFVLYNKTLTAPQMLAISNNMAAL